MSRTERTRYAAVVALVLLAIWGVAGCTGNGNPAASPTTTTGVGGTAGASATASGAATASATGTVGTAAPYPSDVPPEARVNSDAGAIAFTRHFFAQVNKAYTTPQSGLISPLSAPSCKSCFTFESNSRKYVAEGHRHTLEPIDVVDVSVAPDKAEGMDFTLDVVIRQRPSRILTREGTVVETLLEKQGVLAVDVKRHEGEWLVTSIKMRQG